MITDTLTLSIYKEICKCYVEQMKLNIQHDPNMIIDLKTERTLSRFPYIHSKELKTVSVDSYTCRFIDVFEIKRNFDKLVLPKERFYYFNQQPVSAVLPAKAKRAYKKRIRPLMPAMPRISVWRKVILYFKKVKL